MTNIESISVLRQTDRLDQVSQNNDPLFITKNGKSYLVILSPEHYEQIVEELEHYKQAFDKEREIKELAAKVEKSIFLLVRFRREPGNSLSLKYEFLLTREHHEFFQAQEIVLISLSFLEHSFQNPGSLQTIFFNIFNRFD